MLTITVPAKESESWDELNEEFVYTTVSKEQTFQLEHSLLSLSKWESKWHKSFLYNLERGKLSREETIDYIKCMTLTKNVDPTVYANLTNENIQKINAYISDPMTATTFSENRKGSSSKEIVTSEIIYYWMLSFEIPFECEKWHLNRLLTLIRVCDIKGQTPKKMSKGEIMKRNAALNAARKKQLNTRG